MKVTPIRADVTGYHLELTVAEARMLKKLLGKLAGDGAPGQVLHIIDPHQLVGIREKLTSNLYWALAHAGVGDP